MYEAGAVVYLGVGLPYRVGNYLTLYKLLVRTVGLNFTDADADFEYQIIEWRGYEFKFSTHKHEGLRNIQLSLKQSESIQAVGIYERTL